MQICSIPESSASSAMIWMTGLVSPSRSTSGNNSFCTAVEAGYCRVPRPAAVMTALRTLAMGQTERGHGTFRNIDARDFARGGCAAAWGEATSERLRGEGDVGWVLDR